MGYNGRRMSGSRSRSRRSEAAIMIQTLERVLLCNGRILAESCFFQGEAVYGNEAEVLEDLTGGQMERLLRKLAEGGGGERRPRAGRETVNPAFDTARFEALRGEE